MNNLVDKYKDLVVTIFPEFEQTATNIKQVLDIEVKRPYIIATLNGFIHEAFNCKGRAKWNPHDTWDEHTGVAIALTKLRVALNEKTRKFFTKMVWIPKVGETYYVPFIKKLDNNFFGFPSAQAVVWTGNELDLIRLSLGNVYRTKREARKAIRRNILRGQSMVKEFKNNA